MSVISAAIVFKCFSYKLKRAECLIIIRCTYNTQAHHFCYFKAANLFSLLVRFYLMFNFCMSVVPIFFAPST